MQCLKKGILILFFTSFFIVFFLSSVSAAWYNSSWPYRVNITSNDSLVTNSNTNLYFNLSLLPSTFWGNVTSDGGDIRVTKADGETEVAREISGFNKTAERGSLFLNSSGLSTSAGTTWFIYYGNSSAQEPAASSTYGKFNVWDDDYKGVYHFQDDYKDSTSNQINYTLTGSASFVDFGLDKGVEFTTVSDYLTRDQLWSTSTNYTLQEYFEASASPASDPSFDTISGYPLHAHIWGHTDSSLRNDAIFVRASDSTTITASFVNNSADTMYWRVSVYNNTNLRTFVNNVLKSTTDSSGAPQDATEAYISFVWSGTTDITRKHAEVRVSSIPRSNDWLTTEYNNQNENNNFWSVGSVETETDTTPPTFSQNQTNNTIAGKSTLFSLLVDDETALHPNGQYIFSTNNSGTWVNDSAVNFTTTSEWANVTKTLNSTIGISIGYRWYLTDNANNSNNTEIFTLTTTSIPELDSVKLNATSSNNLTTDNLTAYPQNPQNYDTLIYNWKLNGTSISVLNMPFDTNDSSIAKDYSGYGNNGTVNGATWTENGISGGAYDFNSDNITISNSSTINNVFDPGATFTAWINLTGFTQSTAMIAEKWTGDFSDGGWEIYITNDTKSLVFLTQRNTSAGDTIGNWRTENNTINLSQWHFVTVIYNSTSNSNVPEFYIDGELKTLVVGDTPTGTIHSDQDGDMYLGNALDPAQFQGQIDEIKIYDRNLSSEQVSLIYNSGMPKYNITVSQETKVGENWSVEVTPNDQTQDGTTKESNNITIEAEPDNEAPQYSNIVESPSSPATYSFGATYYFNSTWTDNVAVDKVIINFSNTNFTVERGSGTAQNGVYNFSRTDLAVGSYDYYWWANDTSNNDNQTSTFTYTINKATPSGSISGTSPITYGTAADVTGSESNSGDDDVTYKLYRDGVEVSNPDNTVLAAGSYDYVFNTTGGANYTSNSSLDTFTLTVNKANPEGVLTIDQPSWTVESGTEVTIGYSENNSGDDDVTYKVYRDGVDKGSGETFTPAVGSYDYVFNTTGGANYTSNSSIDAETLVVEDTTNPQVSVIYPENTTYSSHQTQLNYSASDTNLANCWYSTDGGATNSSANDCSSNFTGLSSVEGSNTWTVYANDTSGNENSSSVTFTVDTPPTFSQNQTNNTIAGKSTLFSLLVDDETALHPNGQYIFSTNNSGTWVNDSAVNFTTTSEWANVTKTLNSTIGISIGYRWYLTDNANNSNNTEIFTLTTTAEPTLTVTLVDPNSDTNVTQNEFFTFTANITCENANCGHVNASLDPNSWWNNSWSNRINITFNNSASSENLTNFTIMVKLNSSRVNYSKTNDSGQDIRFVDEDDSTELSYEIEKWNESGDSFVWVRVPQVNASSTTDYIYMYYNNPSASDGQNVAEAWDDNYQAVWHLKEDPSGAAPQINDSTNNNHDGTSIGSMTSDDQVIGQVDGSLEFDGSNDGVNLTTSNQIFNNDNNWTILIWFKTTGTLTFDERVFVTRRGTTGTAFMVQIEENPDQLEFQYHDGSAFQVLVLDTFANINNEWHHLVATYDGSTFRTYLDGSPNESATDTFSGFGSGIAGMAYNLDGNNEYFEGFIDEVRASNSTLSADWVEADYLSQTDAINTFGTEESNTKSGLVSTTTGDTPFYTTDSNPQNGTDVNCLLNMDAGETCQVSWQVNATGIINTTHEFFVQADSNNVSQTVSGESAHINITIVEEAADSCTCAGLNTNWEIDMSDSCIIDATCDLGTGNITYINTGSVTFNATIYFQNMEHPSTSQTVYIGSNATLNAG